MGASQRSPLNFIRGPVLRRTTTSCHHLKTSLLRTTTLCSPKCRRLNNSWLVWPAAAAVVVLLLSPPLRYVPPALFSVLLLLLLLPGDEATFRFSMDQKRRPWWGGVGQCVVRIKSRWLFGCSIHSDMPVWHATWMTGRQTDPRKKEALN